MAASRFSLGRGIPGQQQIAFEAVDLRRNVAVTGSSISDAASRSAPVIELPPLSPLYFGNVSR